jgi:hypothetical protein
MREALLSLGEPKVECDRAERHVSIIRVRGSRTPNVRSYNSIKQNAPFSSLESATRSIRGRKLYPAAPNRATQHDLHTTRKIVRHMHTPSPTTTTLISCILRPGSARWQCSIGLFRSHLATERFPHRNHAHLHPQTTVAVQHWPGIGLFRAPRQNMYVAPGAQEPLTVSLCEPSSAPPSSVHLPLLLCS